MIKNIRHIPCKGIHSFRKAILDKFTCKHWGICTRLVSGVPRSNKRRLKLFSRVKTNCPMATKVNRRNTLIHKLQHLSVCCELALNLKLGLKFQLLQLLLTLVLVLLLKGLVTSKILPTFTILLAVYVSNDYSCLLHG